MFCESHAKYAIQLQEIAIVSNWLACYTKPQNIFAHTEHSTIERWIDTILLESPEE